MKAGTVEVPVRGVLRIPVETTSPAGVLPVELSLAMDEAELLELEVDRQG